MADALFFRLTETPNEDKGSALAAAVDAATRKDGDGELFAVDPRAFRQIPGSPFAYWTSEKAFSIFSKCPPAEGNPATIRLGLTTNNDFRFLRLFWEVKAASIRLDWIPFAKGGAFSCYYFDVHLLLDWEENGKRLRQFCIERGDSPSRNIRSEDHYFRPGLTWPRRTQKGLNLRAMPAGCIFADKGPAVFIKQDRMHELLALLGVMNASLFKTLVELQMAFGSYEVGVIQRTPVPVDFSALDITLVLEAHDLTREDDISDETTHAFRLPGLAWKTGSDLLVAGRRLEFESQARRAQLATIQNELDRAVFDLYWLDSAETNPPTATEVMLAVDEGKEEKGLKTPPDNLSVRVQNLIMWCVGVTFGRWDVRFALTPHLLSTLQGPFDPLPRCAPGALVGADGLPANQENIASDVWLSARENVVHVPETPLPNGEPTTISLNQYPIPIAWNNILVDDPTHPYDIVGRVRQVLTLLWGEQADVIEKEACEILGYKSLRDYFRDPRKGFFPFHIKRYSKSRRKAPIYWLLQSENRNYAIWLYYHRLDNTTYFTAARDYADTKVNLETTRLDELRQGQASLQGSALKRGEREIERQQKLVDEVITFRNKLDEIALRQLPPDHNDGVIISIAPLWELVPWKEAGKMWQELVSGKYEWSTMAKQMSQRGLVKE